MDHLAIGAPTLIRCATLPDLHTPSVNYTIYIERKYQSIGLYCLVAPARERSLVLLLYTTGIDRISIDFMLLGVKWTQFSHNMVFVAYRHLVTPGL